MPIGMFAVLCSGCYPGVETSLPPIIGKSAKVSLLTSHLPNFLFRSHITAGSLQLPVAATTEQFTGSVSLSITFISCLSGCDDPKHDNSKKIVHRALVKVSRFPWMRGTGHKRDHAGSYCLCESQSLSKTMHYCLTTFRKNHQRTSLEGLLKNELCFSGVSWLVLENLQLLSQYEKVWHNSFNSVAHTASCFTDQL